MSLKTFHVVFIAAAILLSLFCGGWAVHNFLHEGGPGILVFGLGAFGSAVALIYYSKTMLRKLKDISYL